MSNLSSPSPSSNEGGTRWSTCLIADNVRVYHPHGVYISTYVLPKANHWLFAGIDWEGECSKLCHAIQVNASDNQYVLGLLMSTRMQLAAPQLSCMPFPRPSATIRILLTYNRFTTIKAIETCNTPEKYIYFPDDFYPVINADLNGSFHSRYIIDEEGKIASHS